MVKRLRHFYQRRNYAGSNPVSKQCVLGKLKIKNLTFLKNSDIIIIEKLRKPKKTLAPSTNGLGHRPFTAAIVGSNPRGVTIKAHTAIILRNKLLIYHPIIRAL